MHFLMEDREEFKFSAISKDNIMIQLPISDDGIGMRKILIFEIPNHWVYTWSPPLQKVNFMGDHLK